MGTCIDSTVRFGGSNHAKIAKALDYIRNIQAEAEEYDDDFGECDFSNDPEGDAEGVYTWCVYYDEDDATIDESLRDQLIPLTHGGDFEFCIYWEVNDGSDYESGLEKYQDGEQLFGHHWSDIAAGFELSMTIADLLEQPDAKGLQFLIDAVASKKCSDWVTDETETLRATAKMAATVKSFLDHCPQLLNHELIKETVATLHSSLEEVRQGLDDSDSWYLLSESNARDFYALLALAESLLIKTDSKVQAGNTSLAAKSGSL